MIIFGLLGGTFIPASQFPEAVRTLAKLTPNYWSNSGFMTLISGGSLDDVAEPILALLIMAAGLFIAAVLLARKRWTSGFIRK
jgi:ABC-2 type transport system permease protein